MKFENPEDTGAYTHTPSDADGGVAQAEEAGDKQVSHS